MSQDDLHAVLIDSGPARSGIGAKWTDEEIELDFQRRASKQLSIEPSDNESCAAAEPDTR